MVKYHIELTRQAAKDAKYVASSGLKPKVDSLLALLQADPFAPYPPYEKLIGDLKGAYARRINIQHRLVYKVSERERIVTIVRMWTHYE